MIFSRLAIGANIHGVAAMIPTNQIKQKLMGMEVTDGAIAIFPITQQGCKIIAKIALHGIPLFLNIKILTHSHASG